jgi:ABC-type oligopeptide transport system substrate-binding subunit
MKKITAILITITCSFLLVNCKSENKKEDFTALTKNYFDDKNALDPLGATQNGQTNITISYNFI